MQGFLKKQWQTWRACMTLLLGGPFSVEGRERLHELHVFLTRSGDKGKCPPPLPGELPAATYEEFAKDDTSVMVADACGDGGNVSTAEMIFLCKLARQLCPENVFEIGTFDGRTSLNMAMNIADASHVYTLDLPREMLGQTRFEPDPSEIGYIDKSASGLKFAGRSQASKITQLFGDSATFDYSPYTGRMDLIFVDGSHSYEYVRADSQTALSLLKPEGGTIVWHDYAKPSGYYQGVTRALDELYASGGKFSGLRRITGTSLALLQVPSVPA